jgi:hypothetical protein
VSALLDYEPLAWPSVACDLGFEKQRKGYTRDGYTLSREAGWLVLGDPGWQGDGLQGALGAPGLWRLRPSESEGGWARICEVPPLAGTFESTAPEKGQALAPLLAWSLGVASGKSMLPAGAAFTRERIEEQLPAARRSVRAGRYTAGVEIIADEARTALVAGGLAAIPSALASARRAWVELLCIEAQAHWRIVRIGLAHDTVVAEVDLTGAPESHLSALLELSLAALHCSISWLLPSLAAAVDPAAGSQLLDRGPRRGAPVINP